MGWVFNTWWGILRLQDGKWKGRGGGDGKNRRRTTRTTNDTAISHGVVVYIITGDGG
jgi:hypothetical protein